MVERTGERGWQMTTRSEFLTRVRASLGSTSGAMTEPPRVEESLIRLSRPSADVADRFAAAATATGMKVQRCDVGNASDVLSELLESMNATKVVVDVADEAILRGVPATHAPSGMDAQFDASAGVTGVVAAVAETGTLVVVSGDERSRGSFIVPPVHVAIVRESQIVADLMDVWPLFAGKVPTAITLITGPSKTADIEGILVTGVHGPKEVHVVLVRGT